MNTHLQNTNIFEDIGEIAMLPVISTANIINSVFAGESPKTKDVTTVLGAVVSTVAFFKIF